MEKFLLELDHGQILTGRVTIPTVNPDSPVPLLVCFHGGSYDSEYFDAREDLSIAQFSSSFGAPVIAINRPGYGEGIHHVPPVTSEVTYSQQQGIYINTVLLPAIWKEYGEKSGATAIVLLAHSIGAMMATITAGSYTGREGYPLAGLITSGIGAEINPEISSKFQGLAQSSVDFLTFDPVIKDRAMLQFPDMDLVAPGVPKLTASLNKQTPIGEFMDINRTWLQYWQDYSHAVKVPLMYGISEFDELWLSTPEAVQKYRQAFPSVPFSDLSIVEKAPHCIELSYQGESWLNSCFCFGFRCVEWWSAQIVLEY